MNNRIRVVRRSDLAIVTYNVPLVVKIGMEIIEDARGAALRFFDLFLANRYVVDIVTVQLAQAVAVAWEKAYDSTDVTFEAAELDLDLTGLPYKHAGAPINVQLGGGSMPADLPTVQGFPVFNVVPEPEYLTIGGERFLAWRRKVVDSFSHEREIRGIAWTDDFQSMTVPANLI